MNHNRPLFKLVVIFILAGVVFISCGGRKNDSGQISASESGQEIALPTRDNPLHVSGLPEPYVCGTADCRPDSAKPDSGKSAAHKTEYGSFVDTRDGQEYRTAKIGEFVWMAQNLNYKTDGSWCYYLEDSNCTKYGRLYGWHTAKKVCPAGWHLPAREEWNALVQSAGEETAGKRLKSTSGWNNGYNGKNGNGTDDFGFSALPGGALCYDEDGSFESEKDGFDFIGSTGDWWSATESDNVHEDWERGSGAYAWKRSMYSEDDIVEEHDVDMTVGLSVRCILNY
jgi:uncharacterized protein (TIGR02145 family)